jgi:serine/threonine protein kinase
MSMSLQRLGKYELRTELGRGNTGEVWKAFDLQLRRDVAIKILHTDLLANPQFFAHFTQQGQVLASLHHANIVQIHDVALSRPTPQDSASRAYIVMEYVAGQTLADYIDATVRKGIFLRPDEIVYLFTSLGVAIDYAHQKGIIHGNIKPSNILLDHHNTAQFAPGEPMLTDFALDRLVGDEASVVSPYYISPEQAQGNQPGLRSDIYSLGVILYELCTGVQPFRDESSVAVMMQHINALPTPPSLINPNIPPALSEIILRAMAKESAARFSMASLMAAAIADAYAIHTGTHIPSVLPTSISEDEETEEDGSGGSQPRIPILGVISPSLRLPSRLPGNLPTTPPDSRPQPLPMVPRSQPLVAAQEAQTMFATSATPSSTTGKQPVPPMPSPPISRKIPITPTTFVADQQPTNVMPPVAVPSSATQSTPPRMPSAQPQNELPPVPPAPPARSRSGPFAAMPLPLSLLAVLILLLLVVLGFSISNLFLSAGQAGTPSGHVFFEDDLLGHEDVLRIEIQPIQTPPQGDSDVAWLQTTSHSIVPLGVLTIQNKQGTLVYPGNAQHSNLLPITQGLIISQEKSGALPPRPQGKTVYVATVNMAVFTYVRNILYATPGLPGNSSVVNALMDAIKSMSDKSGSIVDSLRGTHDYGLVRRQAIRIMEQLDSTKYAQQSGDLPTADRPLLFTQIGLLSSPTQKGYLDILDQQLTLLQQHAGNNTELLTHIQNVRNAVVDLKNWLQKVRSYDLAILKATNLNTPTIMNDAFQLKQLVAISYTGQTIPPNNGPLPTPGSAGAYQGYIEAQYLAALDVKAA